MDEDKSDAKIETSDEASGKSDFVTNSQPMREEQVQNAVKFLSHPKVRCSPVIYRRSFLEKKGLTKEEINEAFRRVPDLPPSTATTYAASSNQDEKTQNSLTSQPLPPPQSSKQSAASSADTSRLATSQLSHFHWSRVLFAVGLFAASGAGAGIFFKTMVIPRLKAWIRKVVAEDDPEQLPQLRPNAIEEAVSAAKAAASAAADAAKASQEMLIARNDERKYFDLVTKLLDSQIGEMKSMHNSLSKIQGAMDVSLLANIQKNEKLQPELSGGLAMKPNPTSAPAESMVAAHPKSYMDIMAMVQRGERPSNIQDINDKPPNPNQPPSNPRILPRAKPWEVNQTRATYETRPISNFDRYANEPSQMNGMSANSIVDNYSEPWQRKSVKITEIEPEREWSAVSDDRPVCQGWVPPPPPPISMPEAAVAIRQPKASSIPKDQINEQRVSSHSSISGELDNSAAGSSVSGGAELGKVVGVGELMKANVDVVQPDASASSNGAESVHAANGEIVEI